MKTSSSLGYAVPIVFLISSAVLSPMSIEWFFLMYLIIASSKVSPATFIDVLSTIPPRDITAMSVVPPPTSTTMHPFGFEISIPAPIAAAIGSSIRNTSLAPASIVASITALFSTSVTPEGTHTIIFGLKNLNMLTPPVILSIKYLSIFSVT